MPLVTRGTNSTTHPGAIIRNSSARRPSEVVQAEKAEKANAKAKKVAAKEAGLRRVAELENNSRKRDKETDLDANDPAEQLTIPRKSRARKSDVVNMNSKILLGFGLGERMH